MPDQGGGVDESSSSSVDLTRERSDASRERSGFVEAVDGTPIYYRVTGSGPAVALCDGILCEGYIWKYLRPRLAKHYTVVHWNYRGHGRSGRPRDPERVGIDAHASDLWRVLDACNVERAALAGHSMGTQVCLEGYRANPDRVAGLLLLCGSYGRVTRTFHGTDALHWVLPKLRSLADTYPGVVRSLLGFTPANLVLTVARWTREVDPVRIQAADMIPYFEHLSTMDPAVFLRMLTAAGEHSAEDLLSTVKAPTLVVSAEYDTFTPARLASQMARSIENSELLLVREGTHSAPIEQPELIDAAIERFLLDRVYPQGKPEGAGA